MLGVVGGSYSSVSLQVDIIYYLYYLLSTLQLDTQILTLDINNCLDLVYEEIFTFHNFSIIEK